MKSVMLTLLVILGLSALAHAFDVNEAYKVNTYVAGKTSTSITLSSNTVNFYVTEIAVDCDGGEVVMTSSIASTVNDRVYVNPTHPFKSLMFNPPITYRETARTITLTLPANTTAYYYIKGVKKLGQ